MKNQKTLLSILAISLLIFWSRMVPHEANFSPVLALCLLAGLFSQGRWYGFALPMAALFVSDSFLGFYPGWALTYIPLVLLIAMGFFMKSRPLSLLGFGLLGASTFFAISNLGVWYYSGLYSFDGAGLLQCYSAAIPFFRTTLASTWLVLVAYYAVASAFRLPVVKDLLNRAS